MSVADRLIAQRVILPQPAAPVANYVGAVRTGNLVFVSGQLPFGPNGQLSYEHTGKLKPGAPIDAARTAARLAAINVLAQVKAVVGDLEEVTRVIRLGGFFSVEGGHEALPAAMNGASDLVAEIFGERGRHARVTVGVAHLPLDAICEVEGLFEIAP